MMRQRKASLGWCLLMVAVLLSLTLSCASHKSSQSAPAPAPAPETSVEKPSPVAPPPAEAPKEAPQTAAATSTAKAPPCPKALQGIHIIGEVEPVTILKAGMTLPARIDTGATTSSLDARDIQKFERDGKKWVRFMLLNRTTGKKVEVEGRLTRTVEITRHGTDPQYRPVIKLKAALGEVELYREFSLTDRSGFTYPILIGRNFLEGEFIVDVTRKNTATPMSEDTK